MRKSPKNPNGEIPNPKKNSNPNDEISKGRREGGAAGAGRRDDGAATLPAKSRRFFLEFEISDVEIFLEFGI
jgi:hypothetical protein